MRVGVDFDNTIVSYDTLFHKVAVESGAVPPETPVSKLAVRDLLRRIGREEVWTEMQGLVYGARLMEAEAFPGVVEVFAWARDVGIELSIISHKTRHPFIGPKYDLHAAAREWIETHLRDAAGPFLPPENLFFELTKPEKAARIGARRCGWFIDDLPEILTAPEFPRETVPILFAPEGGTAEGVETTLSDWGAIKAYLDARR